MHPTSTRLLSTVALVAAIVTSGCTSEIGKAGLAADGLSPTSASSGPDGSATSAAPGTPTSPGSSDGATTRPAFEEDEPGRGMVRDLPLAIGSATPVGEDWQVRVTGFDPDATEEVLAFNSQNQAPADGQVYAVARLEATWGGDGTKNAYLALEWGLVDAAGTAWTDDGCGVLPDDLASQGNAASGGTVEGTICFVVDQDILDDVTLYVAPLLGESGTRRWWVAPASGAGRAVAPDPDATDSQ